MLLSCLAMLLGVAVIIFIVFTIGMEERHTNKHTQNAKRKAVHLNFSFSLPLRDPEVNCGMEGVYLKLHLISIAQTRGGGDMSF